MSQNVLKVSKGKSLVSTIAFELLKDAEAEYKTNKKFSDETLQSLHSAFGEPFKLATELLENHKVTVYHTGDFARRLIRLTSRNRQLSFFGDVNFCRCAAFESGTLERKIIACEHVLAVKLAEITGSYREIEVGDSQITEMLNGEMES